MNNTEQDILYENMTNGMREDIELDIPIDELSRQLVNLGTTINRNNSGDARTIESLLRKTPIYILVGHSSLQANFGQNSGRWGTERICTSGPYSSFFKTNDGINGVDIPRATTRNPRRLNNWLSNDAQFVCYPTTPGDWGGLYCGGAEEPGHILRKSARDIKNEILKAKAEYRTYFDKGPVQRTDDNPIGVFPPGTYIPDKYHQFFGDPLSFGGFGIIALYPNSNIGVSATDLAADKDPDYIEYLDNGAPFYFMSNNQEKKSIPKWIYKIAKSARNEEDMPMSEIVRMAGGGIFISLSCSVLRSEIYYDCTSDVKGDTYPIVLLPLNTTQYGLTANQGHPLRKFGNRLIQNYRDNSMRSREIFLRFINSLLPSQQRSFRSLNTSHPLAAGIYTTGRGNANEAFAGFGMAEGEGPAYSTRRRIEATRAADINMPGRLRGNLKQKARKRARSQKRASKLPSRRRYRNLNNCNNDNRSCLKCVGNACERLTGYRLPFTGGKKTRKKRKQRRKRRNRLRKKSRRRKR